MMGLRLRSVENTRMKGAPLVQSPPAATLQHIARVYLWARPSVGGKDRTADISSSSAKDLVRNKLELVRLRHSYEREITCC